jgi:NAD(P)-dependent dehydrogenase (short-subunit alcohol dehydrogenase family)
MDLGLRNARAVVTGGTKGIGRAIAECFADEGANVAICARNKREVEATLSALQGRGVNAFGCALDVADPTALRDWIDDSANQLGGIDALVCNASALAVGASTEAWETSFRTDMMHSVHAVNAALPYLEKSVAGSIVLISSVSGVEPDITCTSYSAIKAALINYAKGLSRQFASKNIRVNCVSPGNTYFQGGFWNEVEKRDPEQFQNTLRANPSGRFGTAEEVARGVVFVSSPAAGRISGDNLVIDGARTLSA